MGKIKTKTKKKSQAVLEQSKFPYQKFRIWWTDPTGDTGWATPAEFDRMVYSETGPPKCRRRSSSLGGRRRRCARLHPRRRGARRRSTSAD